LTIDPVFLKKLLVERKIVTFQKTRLNWSNWLTPQNNLVFHVAAQTARNDVQGNKQLPFIAVVLETKICVVDHIFPKLYVFLCLCTERYPFFFAIDVQGRNLFNRREVQSIQAFCAYTLVNVNVFCNCKCLVLSLNCGTELCLGTNYCIFWTPDARKCPQSEWLHELCSEHDFLPAIN